MEEVFVISRIIKVSVRVICWSWRLKLITLTKTLIFLDITKTKSNHYFIIHWTKKNVFASSLMASNTKLANLTWLPLEIMHCNHTWQDIPATLSDLNMIISISVSGQLPTYPSPSPTLTLTCYQLTVVGLGEG